jgi:uncharacterized protein (DUF924 family)
VPVVMQAMDPRSTVVSDFWFGPQGSAERGRPRKCWFVKDAAFDEAIRSRFLPLWESAARGELQAWRDLGPSALALVIVLDQFSRNLFRGDARAFSQDARALEVAKHLVAQGVDRSMPSVERWFVYLPFEHSESLADQERSLELFGDLAGDPDSASTIDFACRHHDIIRRFGRFPHRNDILGRPSTPEELAFLREPGSRF